MSGRKRICTEDKRLLVESNLDLVVRAANGITDIPDQERDDLLQEGFIALIKAAELWDSSRSNGQPFQSYAMKYIYWSLGKYRDKTMSDYYVPTNVYLNLRRFISEKEEFYIKNGRDPSLKDMEDIYGYDRETIETYERILDRFSYIEEIRASVSDDEENSDIVRYEVPDNEDKIEEFCSEEMSSSLKDIMKEKLKPREYLVLTQRYGLFGEEQLTLEQISRSIGVTRERIRQIEKSAIRKIKKGASLKKCAELAEFYGIKEAFKYTEDRV